MARNWSVAVTGPIFSLRIILSLPDVAKSIYRNATLEKASLLRYMHGRESSLKEVHSGLSAMAAEAHLAMERLTRASEYIDLISTRYSQKLHDLFQILPSIENTLATLEARLLDVATRHEQSLSLKVRINRAIPSYH
ncbi:hypothetical protein FRC03_011155 [Tulasnella sp. 419]|nr:hypothetical protein FRC03_011155 [Tulasnella sp. 419]